MADKDVDSGDGPSLELPTLGLGSLRRKKERPAAGSPGSPPEHAIPPPLAPELEGEPAPPPVPPAEVAGPEATSTRATTDRNPRLAGVVASALTGLLIGLLLVGSVKLALRGCDTLRGTESCGGPGFFLLLAIVIVLMALSTRVLRFLGRQDAGIITLLGVGLAAVISLGLLDDRLLSPWMLLVIPVTSMVTFVGAWWVSSTAATES